MGISANGERILLHIVGCHEVVAIEKHNPLRASSAQATVSGSTGAWSRFLQNGDGKIGSLVSLLKVEENLQSAVRRIVVDKNEVKRSESLRRHTIECGRDNFLAVVDGYYY